VRERIIGGDRGLGPNQSSANSYLVNLSSAAS
jgi:hypothetical protein